MTVLINELQMTTWPTLIEKRSLYSLV